MRSDDELGVLSGAFSSMTVSLRAMTADLRHAADEESRLRTRMEGVVAASGGTPSSPSTSRASSPTSTPPPSCSSAAGAERAVGRPVGAAALGGEEGRAIRTRMAEPADEGWSASATVRTATGAEVPVTISAGRCGAGGSRWPAPCTSCVMFVASGRSSG